MIVAVTGASGKIGRYVIRELEDRNIEYVAISRSKHDGLKKEVVSNFEPYSLKDILSSVDGLIHLAGSTNTQNSRELKKANVDLTRKVMEALPDKLPIVYASSISIYGKILTDDLITEETPPNPDSEYSRTKYEAELVVSKHKQSIILRLGTVYGPFVDYFEILKQINKGVGYLIGDGNNHIPFTYVEDVAQMFVNAVTSRLNDTFLIVGKEPTQREVYSLAAEYLGVDVNLKSVSYSMAGLFAKINQLRGSIITQEHVNILYYNRMFESIKAKEMLNFNPTPFEKGLRQVVDAFVNWDKN